jgi:hypothetical protein
MSQMDRLITELKLPPADAYFKIRHTIEEVNTAIAAAAGAANLNGELEVRHWGGLGAALAINVMEVCIDDDLMMLIGGERVGSNRRGWERSGWAGVVVVVVVVVAGWLPVGMPAFLPDAGCILLRALHAIMWSYAIC